MKSGKDGQSDHRSSGRLQRLDGELGEILARIEHEEVPGNLTKLAEQLQQALKRKREASTGE